jgi:hypothetical protein
MGAEAGETMATTRFATMVLPKPILSNFVSITCLIAKGLMLLESRHCVELTS